MANDVIEKIISDLEQSELDINVKNAIIKLVTDYLRKKISTSLVKYSPTRCL